jgi:tetratricopeptide (TPR) repeat protein
LQPNNPEDISALAQTWVMLGDAEEADRLVLEGLETSGQNATLLTTHWMALMVGRRFEEAEALVRELKQQFGEGLPESLERNFNFQLGMIAMVRADYPEARRLLMAAIREDEQAAYNDDEVTAVTLASLASRELGDTEEAQGLLESAERRIRRGRLNGVDNPDIYYNEAIVLTMHSEPAKALEKLREAYAKGFRQQWFMEIDGRLDTLRQQSEFITLMNRIRDDVSQARMEIQTLALANL